MTNCEPFNLEQFDILIGILKVLYLISESQKMRKTFGFVISIEKKKKLNEQNFFLSNNFFLCS